MAVVKIRVLRQGAVHTPLSALYQYSSIHFRTYIFSASEVSLFSLQQYQPFLYVTDNGKLYAQLNIGLTEKTIVVGEGLGDDMWHSVKLERRAMVITFSVDDERPLIGTIFPTFFLSFIPPPPSNSHKGQWGEKYLKKCNFRRLYNLFIQYYVRILYLGFGIAGVKNGVFFISTAFFIITLFFNFSPLCSPSHLSSRI